jgi:hypothetical protein
MTGGCRRPGLVLAAAALVLSCAKKMEPPSPDRFAPGLEEVSSKSRIEVELTFDEAIDAAALTADSFSLSEADGSPLQIRGVSAGRSSDRVLVWTEPLQPAAYALRGAVRDDAGNWRPFKVRFRGSGLVDTIPPRVAGVQPAAGASASRRIPQVSVSFSEPMDTSCGPWSLFAPSENDSLFRGGWSSDWRQLTYTAHDSAQRAGPVYFLLGTGVRDLEGNRTRAPAYTYFTRDSVFEGVTFRGRVVWEGGPLGTGIVYFDAGATSALAPLLADGTFSLGLDSGVYDIRVLADTNLDRIADLSGQARQVATDAESVRVGLYPESVPRPIDAYRR